MCEKIIFWRSYWNSRWPQSLRVFLKWGSNSIEAIRSKKLGSLLFCLSICMKKPYVADILKYKNDGSHFEIEDSRSYLKCSQNDSRQHLTKSWINLIKIVGVFVCLFPRYWKIVCVDGHIEIQYGRHSERVDHIPFI